MCHFKSHLHKFILTLTGLAVLAMGIALFFIPPALSIDPSLGFQVLRSMHLGAGFNNLVSPDHDDISKNYAEFFTWWSPGQYLAPHLIETVTGATMGRSLAITVTIADLCGLGGLYYFFKKLGFSRNEVAASILFIICQMAFMIPHIYYNGGEILLFSFYGWFLFGCLAFEKIGAKLAMFIVFSGFVGFFLKSSFLWIYGAGLACLWVRLTLNRNTPVFGVRNALWIGLPATMSYIILYLLYISRGASPVTVSYGYKLTPQVVAYPLASPLLAGFSIDEMLHGLVVHMQSPLLNSTTSLVIMTLSAIASLILISIILRYVPHLEYKIFLICFYATAFLFFGLSYLHQLDISMDPRHFRVIALLIVPGVIYLVRRSKPVYKILSITLIAIIAYNSICFLVNGYKINSGLPRGVTGVAQTNIDQTSLDKIIALDNGNRDLTFVLIGDDISLEVVNNRIITLQPISNDLEINKNDYIYEGHGGPLCIILPKSYIGSKEKFIIRSFPGYKSFTPLALSNNYILYSAR